MNAYLIMYELQDDSRYGELVRHIKDVTKETNPLPLFIRSLIVKSILDAREIKSELSKHLDPHDRIVIIGVGNDVAAHGVPIETLIPFFRNILP